MRLKTLPCRFLGYNNDNDDDGMHVSFYHVLVATYAASAADYIEDTGIELSCLPE